MPKYPEFSRRLQKPRLPVVGHPLQPACLSRREALKRLGYGLTLPALHGFVSPFSALAWAQDKTPYARRIADYICDVRFEDLSSAVVAKCKEHLIYHVGLAFSGALTANGEQGVEIARTLSGGRGDTTIIGHGLKVPMLESAFANSMFIRALGYDDVLFPSATHAGLLTYPVAMAVGEQQHRSGKEFMLAVVTGYEVLGKLVTEQDECRAPRRPSMPFGPFASATVAARLMQLEPAQAANAIGYAADTAMGLKAGHEQQPTHVYGWIARNAITAAIVAQAGGETSPTILEEKYGYFNTMIGEMPNLDAVVERLGQDPEILRATQKRYPGTAMNIVPIELVREMIAEHRLNASNVASVALELPEWRKTFETSTATGPYGSRTQAESSVPFQIAIMLLDGRQDNDRYEQLDNPEILDVTRRITVRLAPHDNERYAGVVITTTDGSVLQAEGEDFVFPPLDGLEWLRKDGEKFLPVEQLRRFAAMVERLENIDDVGVLLKELRPA